MTDQNIEQQIRAAIGWTDIKKREEEVAKLVSKLVSEARKELLKDLADHGEIHHSIFDYRIEAEQTPPTPNGDEQGGLERPEEAQSE